MTPIGVLMHSFLCIYLFIYVLVIKYMFTNWRSAYVQ